MKTVGAQSEKLSDNSKHYEQCKTCDMIGDDIYSNRYNKGYCQMFPYPDETKPSSIMENKEDCPYYEKKGS